MRDDPFGRMRALLKIVAALLCAALFPSYISAQGLSGNRPIRIIVPVPPGGPSDTAVRLILPRLTEGLKQAMVADNRGSSNGVAGTDIAAKAAPDGYTLAVGNSGTHGVKPSPHPKLPHDPARHRGSIP